MHGRERGAAVSGELRARVPRPSQHRLITVVSAGDDAAQATKAAAINMTQSFSLELAPHKIRVNCYQPGHIETPLWDDLAVAWKKATGQGKDEMIDLFRSTVPWGRFGTPDDVAAVCSFLATDEAEYITGQAIAMNGAEMLF